MPTLYNRAESNTRRTWILIFVFLILVIGLGYLFSYLLDSYFILIFAVLLSITMSFSSYWYSDKIVLKMNKAQRVEEEDSELYRLVENLCITSGLPQPDIYLIDAQQPNAFATGRNPENSAVAVTRGILDILDKDELEGVLAHELAHVQHRDILISTIAATIAGAITLLATMARWSAIFGLGGRDGDNNLFATLAMAILAPIAAMMIQMAVSRSREYAADKGGANLSKKPQALASALQKLEEFSKRRPMQQANANTAHMFIVNPLTAEGFSSLFRTHPSTEERIKRLRNMRV